MKLSLIIIFLILPFWLSAQSPKKFEKAGDLAFKEQNYSAAVDFYTRASTENPPIKLAWKLAESARLNRDYKLAEKWYKYVAELKNKEYKLAYFKLASVEKSMGNYQKAQNNFRNAYQVLKNDNSYYEKKSRHEITACENALFMTFEPVNETFTIFDSLFNSNYSEFQAYQPNDSLRWLTVLRPETSGDTINILSRVVQYSRNSQNLQWEKANVFNPIINLPGYHISSLTIDTTLKIIIFSACVPSNEKFNCDLWQMPLTNDTTVKPFLLSNIINSSGYSTTHPHIARVNKKAYLLFSSDRPGGEGNMDIWMSSIDEKGNFAMPQNPGKVINTIDDEVSPFYDPYNKALYFSSEWYNSLGGLDIFKIQTNFETWGYVENLGYPVNSSFHDLFYMHSENHDFAFMSSNRPINPGNPSPGCCNDIYYKEMPKIVNDSLILAQRIIIIKKKTRQLIPLNLFFHNDEPNPRSWDTTTTLSYQDCFDSYIKLTDEYIREWKSPLKDQQAENAGRQIENFFIDSVETNFNKFRLFADYMLDLLQNGKNIEITIKGYASPLNTSDYNANLSKRRIQSLANYLRAFKDGALVPYIDGQSEKGNSLIIHREAFGKEKAAANVSGNINDLRNSVYNPDAANERKVAIIAVEF